MSNIIYGVDADGDFSAKDVRDAILLCFKKAHSEILNQTFVSETLSLEEVENMKKVDIEMQIRKSFEKTGGDYNNPTKESLISVVNDLKQFAINFRAEDIANKNLTEIMILINRIK